MNNRSLVTTAAVGSLLALGSVSATLADSDSAMEAREKCFGIAMAGQNDCAAKGHSCQGQARTDKDPADWKNVPAGKCAEMGGVGKADDKSK